MLRCLSKAWWIVLGGGIRRIVPMASFVLVLGLRMGCQWDVLLLSGAGCVWPGTEAYAVHVKHRRSSKSSSFSRGTPCSCTKTDSRTDIASMKPCGTALAGSVASFFIWLEGGLVRSYRARRSCRGRMKSTKSELVEIIAARSAWVVDGVESRAVETESVSVSPILRCFSSAVGLLGNSCNVDVWR